MEYEIDEPMEYAGRGVCKSNSKKSQIAAEQEES